jgi:CubicO group peptidase (beta-lactamase class C family)
MTDIPEWLAPALDYIPRWLEYQMRVLEQPGCAMAVAYRGTLVLEHAIGLADQKLNIPLTPRHRFRVASHSKTFTAAGLMMLREQGRITLEDRAGQYVPGLHPELASRRSRSCCLTRLASAVTGQKRPTGWTVLRSRMSHSSVVISQCRQSSRQDYASNIRIMALRLPGA